MDIYAHSKLQIISDDLAKTTVIYIEEDEPLRSELNWLLLTHVDNVYSITNCSEAFEILDSVKVDVIIVSLNEKNTTKSLEFFKYVKDTFKEIITFSITEPDRSDDLLKCISIDLDEYVIKPINNFKLLLKLDKYAIAKNEHELLEQYTINLQAKIEEALDANRNQDLIMQQQSSQAAMGELINSIAHQWRQPLNSINLHATNMLVDIELEEVPTVLLDHTNAIISLVKDMSNIITDFMEFSRPEQEKSEFFIHSVMTTLSKMLESQLFSKNIKLSIDIDSTLKISSFKHPLEHTIINIVNNAKDVLSEKAMEDKEIKIYTSEESDTIKIYIEDNAGGVPEAIIDKIFDPYFTTKPKGIGTGIGLSMVRDLVTNKLNGSIEVVNINGGALFTITLSK